MQTLATRILHVLADGQFHSGDALGARFGVSKTSIWKAIGSLGKMGLDVHSVRGKGYRLCEKLCLLSEDAIRGALDVDASARISSLEVLPEIDSTNAHLLRRVQGGLDLGTLEQVQVCLAERQHAGRGRRGRTWVSPFGSNVYLSLLATFEGGAAALTGLSLVVGVAVAEALQLRGVRGLGLKWPNDIYCGDCKLGGVLLEVSGDLQNRCHVVIGVGLNVRARAEHMTEVTQPWTDLVTQGFDPDLRNILVADLLNCLVGAVTLFRQQGFGAFLPRWQALDLSRDRPLEVLPGGDEVVRGRGQGVDEDGALLVATERGLRKFHGGEVSLRLGVR